MLSAFKHRLLIRKRQGHLRSLPKSSHLIDFASNDYLGLAHSSELKKQVQLEEARLLSSLNGLGSTGSRLLTGNCAYAEELERSIARFHLYESATLFNCGYMANIGLLSAVARAEDLIVFDQHIHASLREGIRLCRAQAFSFRHNHLDHLQSRLKQLRSTGHRFLCVESIYSTDGSQAPLQAISELASRYGFFLIVDEAHAGGVCGPQGRGLIAKLKLTSSVFAQIITFGKAMGVHGAAVLGSSLLQQLLINFATSYIYTTALPLQTLIAIRCSYDLLPTLEMERKRISHLIALFQKRYPTSSSTHIQSIPFPGNTSVKRATQFLQESGFDVCALMSPTVRRGQERLRICLHSFNTEEQLETFLSHALTLCQTQKISSHFLEEV